VVGAVAADAAADAGRHPADAASNRARNAGRTIQPSARSVSTGRILA
jgi:hypothetical protein